MNNQSMANQVSTSRMTGNNQDNTGSMDAGITADKGTARNQRTVSDNNLVSNVR